MRAPVPPDVEFQIGQFTCPETHRSIPVNAHHSWSDIEWPITIKSCPVCGKEHIVRLEDLEHPPLFGYE